MMKQPNSIPCKDKNPFDVEKMNEVIRLLQTISTKYIITLGNINKLLKAEGRKEISQNAIQQWKKEDLLKNLSLVLSKNGGISTAMYYYPQILYLIDNHLNKTKKGRKPNFKETKNYM